ncbi:unnamed protein product, partial [marine sediment metagenome]
ESELDKSALTYLTDCGKTMRIPNIVFLIEGERKIVVDTSFESVEKTKQIHNQRVWRSKEEEVDQALKNIQVDPREVEIVIFTHLHYDHCGNNHLFSKARFIVQREELRNAFVPTSGQETAYFSPIIGATPSFLGTKFELVQGDVKITEGISVITTPGHTPGSQAVLVETTKGVYCIAGDVVPLYENVEKNIPSGYHDSVQHCYRSIEKIRRLSHYVIPGHEPAL